MSQLSVTTTYIYTTTRNQFRSGIILFSRVNLTLPRFAVPCRIHRLAAYTAYRTILEGQERAQYDTFFLFVYSFIFFYFRIRHRLLIVRVFPKRSVLGRSRVA